jgi:curved DNA-binding protein CbpA
VNIPFPYSTRIHLTTCIALRYHPDRNRGREDEASHKFQEMSRAYEILTDPEKRAKYDADRWRQTLHAARTEGTTDSPPRSPFVVNTGFPPPPRRTQAQHAPPPRNPAAAPTAKHPPSSGANRYTPFTRNFTQSRDEQAKAQAYSAWEQMKHRGNQAAPPPPPRRPPPRPNSYAAPNNATAKQRAGWEDTPPPKAGPPPADAFVNGVPNTPRPTEPGKSPKRPTFFPGPPEAGEDPSAARQQSAYYNVRGGRPPQRTRPQSPYVPPMAQPPSGFRHVNPRQAVPNFKVPPPDDSVSNRQSAPYATAGGEKTYLGTESLNRSASTASNLHTGWAENCSRDPSRAGANARHRSASPHMRSPRPPEDYSDSSSSESSEEDEEDEQRDGRARDHYARRASADDRYRGTYSHPKHPGVTVEVEDDDDTLHPRRADGSRPATRPPSAGEPTEGFQQHRMRVSPRRSPEPINTKPFGGASPMEKPKDSQGRHGPAPNGRQFERPPPATAGVRSKSPKYVNDSTFPYANTVYKRYCPAETSQKEPQAKRPAWPLWALPSSISPTQRLYPEISHVKRLYSHVPPTELGFRSNSQANIHRASFFIPTDSGSSTKNSSTENVDKRFSPTAWHDKFNDPNTYLAAQKPVRTGTSGRGRSPPKPRSATATAFPQNQPSTTEDGQSNSAGPATARPNGPIPAPDPAPPKFSQEEWQRQFKEASWAYPGATTPSQKGRPRTPRKNSAHAKKSSTPRTATFSGGPSEDGTNNLGAKRSMSAHSIHSNGSAMDLDPKPEAPPVDSRQPSMAMRDDPIANIIRSAVPPTAKKDEFDEFDDDPLAFEALKHTDPLAPSNQGLQSMGDLATTLPFESQASVDPATKHVPRPRELPGLPTAPDPPQNPTLTQSGWEQYVSHFDGYLLQWNMFNQRMVNHFQARHNGLQELPKKWTTVASNEGISRYMAGVDEDFRVREHWDKGWGKHRENMVVFAKVRNKAAKADLLETT